MTEQRLPLEQRNSRIYLTGFMGSGKSTIGPILANSLGYEFVDLDRSIEEEQGMSVNAIFQRSGEAGFRVLERDALRALQRRDRVVIALGGGTLTTAENLERVLASGIVVYLKISIEQLHLRLRRKGDRPMLAGADGQPLDDETFRARVASLYAAREPLYAQADFTFQTDQARLGITVDTLIRRLAPIAGT